MSVTRRRVVGLYTVTPDREQTAFVLEDFHRMRDPRRMTEAYFDRVLERFDAMA
ncbi:MAG: hypothetical protein ABEJ86_06875 [Halococcoides sp.]